MNLFLNFLESLMNSKDPDPEPDKDPEGYLINYGQPVRNHNTAKYKEPVYMVLSHLFSESLRS